MLPPGWETKALDSGSYSLSIPGVETFRVTARGELFEDHPDSMAFFTLGGPVVSIVPTHCSMDVTDQDELSRFRLPQLPESRLPPESFSDLLSWLE